MRSAVVKDKTKDKNVVICRLKKASKRFELSINKDLLPSKAEVKAADAAKVIKWDLVLSAPVIFANAVKSEPAKPQDLLNAFPLSKDDPDTVKSDKDIYVEILSRGEVMLSEEQRAEASHKDKDHFEEIAAAIVSKVHVRPSAEPEEGKKKKQKGKEGAQRLGVFPQEEIERELKNAKFKPVSEKLKDQVTEAIAVLANCIELVRQQSAVTVQGDGAPDMVAVQAQFESKNVGYILALPLAGEKKNQFKCVFDPECKDEVTSLATKLQCKVTELSQGTTQYLPTSPDEDLSFAKPESALSTKERHARLTKREKKAAAATAGGEEKPVAKVGKKGKKGPDSDDEGGAKNSLEAQLAALKADDSDDGGKKGKKGKKGKGGGGNQPQPKKQAPVQTRKEESEEEEESSEDEIPVPTMKPKKRR